MMFYVMMPDDKEEDAIPVGELSFGTLWTDTGFWVIERQIQKENMDFVKNAIVIDERSNVHSIQEFIDMLNHQKISLR